MNDQTFYVDPDQSNDAAWLAQAQAASRPPYPSRDALAHHLRVALDRLAYRTEHERVTVAAYTEAVVNLRAVLQAKEKLLDRLEYLAQFIADWEDSGGDYDGKPGRMSDEFYAAITRPAKDGVTE